MKRSVTASPSGLAARRMAAGAVRPVPRCPSGQGRPPRSPDTSPAAATARRRRTASGSPGTPLPPSPDAPETLSADAPPAACGCSRLHRQAHDVVRPRRLEPAEDIAGVQRPGSRLDWSQDFTVAPLAPDRHSLVRQRSTPAGLLEVDLRCASEQRNRQERQYQTRHPGAKGADLQRIVKQTDAHGTDSKTLPNPCLTLPRTCNHRDQRGSARHGGAVYRRPRLGPAAGPARR